MRSAEAMAKQASNCIFHIVLRYKEEMLHVREAKTCMQTGE